MDSRVSSPHHRAELHKQTLCVSVWGGWAFQSRVTHVRSKTWLTSHVHSSSRCWHEAAIIDPTAVCPDRSSRAADICSAEEEAGVSSGLLDGSGRSLPVTYKHNTCSGICLEILHLLSPWALTVWTLTAPAGRRVMTVNDGNQRVRRPGMKLTRTFSHQWSSNSLLCQFRRPAADGRPLRPQRSGLSDVIFLSVFIYIELLKRRGRILVLRSIGRLHCHNTRSGWEAGVWQMACHLCQRDAPPDCVHVFF